MLLILSSTPDSGYQRLLPLLKQIGFHTLNPDNWESWGSFATTTGQWQQGGCSPVDQPPLSNDTERSTTTRSPTLVDLTEAPERLSAWLDSIPDSHLLLLYGRPEFALCRGMNRGQSPGDGSQRWDAATRQLLALYQRYRQRALCVDSDEALWTPDVFLANLAQHLNLTLGNWSVSASSPDWPGGIVESVIATQVTAQSQSLRALQNELDRITMRIGTPLGTPIIDCDQVWASYQSLRHRHDDSAQSLAETPRQMPLGAKVQNPSTEVDPRSKTAVLGQSSGLAPLMTHPQAGEHLQLELADALEENALLLGQLHYLQDQLEYHYQQARAADYQAKPPKLQPEEAHRALQRAQQQCIRLKRTLSWRITAPLRWVFRPIKRRLRAKFSS